MKKCNTEIMKEIKILEEKKLNLLKTERSSKTVSYLLNEEPMKSSYDYNEFTRLIDECDVEIRRLKSLLAYSNVTTIVEGFDMTISDALVYLAQLNEKARRLDELLLLKPLSRTSSYDSLPEFTKICYDQDVVRAEYERIRNLIPRLQMAIDRTNLNNMIEC